LEYAYAQKKTNEYICGHFFDESKHHAFKAG
jgi:hypothetical protein